MTESIDIVVPAVGGADAAAASIRDIGTAADDAKTHLDTLGGAATSAGSALGSGAGGGAETFHQGAEHATEGAAHLEEGLNSLKETLLALGLALGFREWIELTDTFTVMIGRLDQVTTSEKNMKDTFHELLGVANNIHAPLEQVSELYVAMAKNSDALGTSSKENMAAITTIGDAMRSAGKSTEEMSSVTTALGRSFETGSFQGRGWMAVLKGAPELAIALGHSFNMTTKQLGAALQSGTIGMREFVHHLIGLQDEMAASSGKMEVTVGQAWQNMKNAVMAYFGESDRASGASNLLAQAILFIARNANVVMPVLVAVGAALTAMAIAAGLAAISSFALLSPFVMIAGAVAAATVLLLSFGNEIELVAGKITLLGAVRGIFTLLWNMLQEGAKFAVSMYEAIQKMSGGFITAGGAARFFVGALAALAAISIASWAAGAVLSIGPLVVGLGLAAAALLSLAAAIDVCIIGWQLWNGKSLQDAINSAKAFNDQILATATTMKNTFVGAMESGTKSANPFAEAIEKAKREVEGFGNGSGDAAKKVSGHMDSTGSAAVNMANRVVGAFHTMQDAAGNWVGEMASDSGKVNSSMDSVHGPSSGGGGGGGGGGSKDIMGGTNPLEAGQSATVQLGGRGDYLKTLQALSGLKTGSDSINQLIKNANEGDQGSLTRLHAIYNAATEAQKALLKQLFQGGYAGMGTSGRGIGGDALIATQGFASGGAFTVAGQGGTDSQLVQFMATPGEHVSVQTPGQQAATGAAAGDGGRPVHVHMTVHTEDAASFGRSQRQIATALQGRLSDVARYIK